MMKTLLLGVALTSSVLAQTQYSPYLSISGGGSFPMDSEIYSSGAKVGEVKYDSGGVIEGAVGIKIDQNLGSGPFFRVELAGFYEQNDIESINESGVQTPVERGEVRVGTLLLNGYIDIPLGRGFTPYLLGGLGYARVLIDVDSDNSNHNKFSGQVGAGIGYSLTEHLILDLKYKYFMVERFDIGDERLKLSSNQLLLGLRYEF